MLALSKKQPAR